MRLSKKTIFWSFLFFILGLLTGFYFENFYHLFKPESQTTFQLNFSPLNEAYQILKENFVEKEKIDPQKIIFGAIKGMAESLGDPYTTFFNPQEKKFFEQETSGYFQGVGMEIGIKKNQLQIIAPLEGTPAQRAGLLPGDIILKIDGKETFNMSLDEAVSLIRGPAGTEVRLTIYRDEWKEPRDFVLKREVIKIPTLKWEIKKDIVYLKIYHFTLSLPDDFRKFAFQVLTQDNQKKMILDLRNNPGGYLDVVEEIGGYFLKKGNVLFQEKFMDGKIIERRVGGLGIFSDWKIVVLINKGSASGSEILASALRENLDAKLVGEKTFGKGSVQQLFTMKNNGALKITVRKWLTKKGEEIEGKGLIPDIEIENKEDKDLQLEKAIELLSS